MGEQVIDLEGLARHKGSSFGGIGQHSQPTTEQFQNDLFDQWRKLDLRKRVWVEDESFSIGSVQLPYELWEQLKAARMLRVQVPRSARINRLVREYGQQDQEALADAIRRIEKRLSTPRMLQALDDLQNNRLHEVADNLLNYYDRSYGRNMERRDQKSISPVICEKDEPESNARLLQQAAGRLSSTTLNS
jgi:tRNA 2-selenouridine synthase